MCLCESVAVILKLSSSMSPHMSCCILCGLDGAFGSKADFCLCYEAVVLILKMASFSPGCELDDQAYLCFLKAVTLFM